MPNRPNIKYCSKECKYKKALKSSRRKRGFVFIEEKRKCKFCNKEFIWSSSSPQQLYCSKRCCLKYVKKEYIKENPKKPPEANHKKCVICGKDFISFAHNALCCSDSCKKIREKQVIKRKRQKKEIDYSRKCPNCGNYLPKFNRLFCSEKCYREYQKKNKGNNKTTRYLRLRFEVFKRDNFTCQYCGRNVVEDKVKIQTDHIMPESRGGKSVYTNLTTACRDCNYGKGDVLLSECSNSVIQSPEATKKEKSGKN